MSEENPVPDSHTTSTPLPLPGHVRLADRTVAVSALRAHPDRYTHLYARARAETGYAVCLCHPSQQPRLVLRCRAGRWHLANWPEQGHLHEPNCSWFRPNSTLSGRSAYSDAITPSSTGTSIRMSTPLITRTTPARPTTTKRHRATASSSRRSMGLLAFLHYLWEQSGLSVWNQQEGHRDWNLCHSRLTQAAGDCSINGQACTTALYVVPPFHITTATSRAAEWQAFTSRLGQQGTSHHYGLVLGEIRALDRTQYDGLCLRLAHQSAPLFGSRQLAERVRRSYRAAFTSSATKAAGHQLALGVVDRSARGYTIVSDLAVMLTSAAWLPVESGYELRMADALVAAGRNVVKPLRYDQNTAVFPDFVLVDTQPWTYVEVWGIQNREEYEQRKRQKQAIYKTVGPLIEWDTRYPLPAVTRP